MDEKPSNANPSNDPDQNRNEIVDTEETLDASSPGNASSGGWAFMTQAHYDPDEGCDLTTVIIGAIADAEDVSIVEIKDPPLYEVVDITGIDEALFGRPEANRDGTKSSVEFRYNQYRVRIEADGWVTVSSRALDSTADEE